MIRLNLNGKSRIIPEAHELTVAEYIQLANSESQTLFDYLAITLKLEKEYLMNAEMPDFFKIEKKVGKLSDPFAPGAETEKQPAAYIKKMKLTGANINKVGHRMLFESKAKTTDNTFELALFVLSMVHMPNVFDFDKVNANIKQFLDLPYVQILPVSAFFLTRFLIRYKSGRSLLKILQANIRTKIFQLKKMPALMRFNITLLSLNFKEFRILSIYRMKKLLKLKTH